MRQTLLTALVMVACSEDEVRCERISAVTPIGPDDTSPLGFSARDAAEHVELREYEVVSEEDFAGADASLSDLGVLRVTLISDPIAALIDPDAGDCADDPVPPLLQAIVEVSVQSEDGTLDVSGRCSLLIPHLDDAAMLWTCDPFTGSVPAWAEAIALDAQTAACEPEAPARPPEVYASLSGSVAAPRLALNVTYTEAEVCTVNEPLQSALLAAPAG